ncbi:hypothetical protein SAMN04488516_103213 [Desulfonauticus submarinus]|uniref:Twitching motility protein PilT n=1 Tax=Desulfonauticus submarinus TaxID=206665 RepID=A0A1H0CW82_9BACT|nr:Mut7-C RNAse domain-containing protein [Desulfonauticus submarinus]SDN62152.1 hypothetical protein SAMN04488516_103213 [Desulfonauticus submarinus]
MTSFKIYFIFSSEYKFFLKNNNLNFGYTLKRRASIKDILESFGIPHPEIGKIFCFQQEVDFFYIPKPRDVFKVYYHTLPLDISQKSILRPRRFLELKFICDVNVGKLATLLRMAGEDVLYNPIWDDFKIAQLAWQEQRVVLTKDRGLLKRKLVEWGYLLRSSSPDLQLKEVKRVFGLKGTNIFKRCLCCNAVLEPIEKTKILDKLEPKTKKYYNEFFICPECGKIYWRGSHFEYMRKRLLKNGFKLAR